MSDELRQLADDAIRQQIASKVLEGINSEHRDTILRRSVEEALKSYSFKDYIDKCVAGDASKVATEMLKTEFWKTKITQAVEEALTTLCSMLSSALLDTFLEAVAGRDSGSYDRGPGLIYKHLRKST